MIEIIIGNQGSGKSTYGVIQALKEMKKGRPVFSNLPLKGAYKFDKSDIMVHEFPKDSVLLFDEGATFGLGSRGNQYKKNTTAEIVEFFTMHRHYHIHRVIIISPNFTDIIPSVRDNATRITLIKRGLLSLFGLVAKKEIKRGYQIDDNTQEIKYAYNWVPFSTWWFRPSRAYKYFDSWVSKELIPKKWEKYSELECDFENGKHKKGIGFGKKILSLFKDIKKEVKDDKVFTEDDEKYIKDCANMDKKHLVQELQKSSEE